MGQEGRVQIGGDVQAGCLGQRFSNRLGQAERSAAFTAAQPLRLSGVGLRFQTTSCHRE